MSENYSVRYSPMAMDDLRAIYTYIAEHLQVSETAKKQVGARIKIVQVKMRKSYIPKT